MSKLLKVSTLSLLAASFATCEARGNLRRLENLNFHAPPASEDGNRDEIPVAESSSNSVDSVAPASDDDPNAEIPVFDNEAVLANDEALVQVLKDVIKEDSGESSSTVAKSVPEFYGDSVTQNIAKDEALVELLAELISEDSDEPSSEDASVGNYDEIPVPESSSDSEDAPPVPDDDPYAEIPVFDEDAAGMEVKSRDVDADEIRAVLGKVPSDPHADVPVFDIEDASLGVTDADITGDSAATNYFIGHDIGGMEGILGMEGLDGEEDMEEDMEDSPEEDSAETEYMEDPYESHDELPVTDPGSEE